MLLSLVFYPFEALAPAQRNQPFTKRLFNLAYVPFFLAIAIFVLQPINNLIASLVFVVTGGGTFARLIAPPTTLPMQIGFALAYAVQWDLWQYWLHRLQHRIPWLQETHKPSLSENCGGAIEALMLGKPTVVTDVGGLIDIVKDHENGIVVRASDSQDLARGILELLRHPELARRLAQRGRHMMSERFTLDRTADDMAGLYQKLIEERGGRPAYNLLTSIRRSLIAGPFSYMISRLILDIYDPAFLARALH